MHKELRKGLALPINRGIFLVKDSEQKFKKIYKNLPFKKPYLAI